MAKIKQDQKTRELKNRKALKKIKPWLGNGIGRIRSLGRPMASRASRGNR